jgi:2-methylcitrate dehydratase PrpD
MSRLAESTLVEHVLAQASRPVPPDTRERIAQALLDWFTAGWSGAAMDAAPAFRQVATVAGAGAPGEAPVFGGTPAAALPAAFANAAVAHLREIDDAHRAAMLHPGVVSISPVLALAATGALTQRELIAAVVAGYEVSLRIGEALGPRHAGLFHATATAGAIGAGAAAGIASKLPPRQLHHALGLAATQSAGLWQLADDDAHESKSLHPGFAVRNGMMAVAAAQAGLPGPQAFVTGKRALYALLAGDGPLQALDGGLDAPDRINTATIKAWPSCAMTFTALDALRALLDEHRFGPDAVEAVDVEIFSHALRIANVDWPAKAAETPFSLRYLVAALLLTGQLGIEEMESPRLADATLVALGRKVRVVASEPFQQAFPKRRPARVTVHLKDGREFSAYRELRRGDPEDPFDWPGLLQRMRAFCPRMDDHSAARITGWCEAFADPARDDRRVVVDAALFGGP